ncbi:hypothetical protein C5Y96_12885 [Blastopirellula marina]|uniref:DUF1963 domain-containing protein n=1 Tax=Blastopirellula marina TaxID=124 RepID=A0A2S8FH56_9BACT|nr:MULTISPECIES: DUF1963 domain-containing protein [Pirellulaceae]PQO31234.1 hypothetical protein C5Y96_12885 [Blastopirellula marina]RCS51628.1 DUF1963 domain-containing protein [Bremerella cremea]
MWNRKNSEHEQEIDRQVRGLAKPVTRFRATKLKPGESLPITATRFGGTPYAEAGEQWPMFGNYPFDFVAQFNLTEIEDPPTDAYELFTVYLCWEGLAEDPENCCLVRTYNKPSAEKAFEVPRPEPQGQHDYQVQACGVERWRADSYPSPLGGWEHLPVFENWPKPLKMRVRSFRDELIQLGRSIKYHWTTGDVGQAYLNSLRRIGCYWKDGEVTQVGGYPYYVHDATMDDDDCFLLAQISYEPAANFCIGDAANCLIAACKSNPTQFWFDAFQTH